MIRTTIDVTNATRALGNVHKQMRFAASQALNDAAFAARVVERQRVQRAFTIRRPWVVEGIQVAKPLATKANLQVTVEVEEQRDFLFKFERGDDKTPRGTHLAVPDDEGLDTSKVIPRGKRPRAFKFQLRQTKTGKRQLIGDQRTFVPDLDAENPIVLQRKGRGKRSKTVLLYQFVKEASIDPSLKFVDTVTRVFAQRFPTAFAERFRSAMKDAKP